MWYFFSFFAGNCLFWRSQNETRNCLIVKREKTITEALKDIKVEDKT